MPKPAVLASLAVAASCAALAQQPPADPPRFEVATVRLNTSTNNAIGNHFDPGRASWTNVPLRVLITNAYAIRPYQLFGGPDWLDTDRWDIDAKTETPNTTMDKFRMLRPLLADRFQLKIHRETRELARYTLTVAKGGHKLKQPEPADTGTAGLRTGSGLLIGHKYPVADFIGWLALSLSAPVDDKTGITGQYNFELRWNPDYGQTAAVDAGPPSDGGVSIFTAIQEQLGLKLEAGKGPVEVIVIDSVQKASGN
jgi:uncharacterized protein (TIGR03435 family)